MKHLTTFLAVFATLLFASACEKEEEATEETTTETAPEAEEETAEAEEAAEPAEAEPAQAEQAPAGGSACERAQSCCEGYVNEMNAMAPNSVTADTACAGIAAARNTPGGAGDATCNQIITTFRTTLEQSQRTVPASCGAQ